MDREAIRKPVQRKRSRRRPSTEKRIPARRAMIPPAKAITVCRTRPSCGSENLVWRSWLETKRASEEPSRPNRRISPQSQAWKSSLLSCRMFTLSADPSSPISVEALMAERILLVDDHPLTRSAVARRLLEQVREGGGRGSGVPDSIAAALSARELEVLLLLDDHLATDEIAKRLFISEHTVRSHVKSLLRKLGVSSRRGALEALSAARR